MPSHKIEELYHIFREIISDILLIIFFVMTLLSQPHIT